MIIQKITKKEYNDWLPAYRFAKANKATKLDDHKLDFNLGMYDFTWDAVHFRADALIEALKKKCKRKIKHYDDEII